MTGLCLNVDSKQTPCNSCKQMSLLVSPFCDIFKAWTHDDVRYIYTETFFYYCNKCTNLICTEVQLV
jgi:hypothetical protein